MLVRDVDLIVARAGGEVDEGGAAEFSVGLGDPLERRDAGEDGVPFPVVTRGRERRAFELAELGAAGEARRARGRIGTARSRRPRRRRRHCRGSRARC